MHTILICYGCSQIFKLIHSYKGLTYLYFVTLSYILVVRHDHIGYFVFSAVTSRPVSLVEISKVSVLFIIVRTFPPISVDQ